MAKKDPSAERQLAELIAKFDPPMARFIRAARRRMRSLLPRASELVYDNYNFLAIGYGPNERAGQAMLSLAAHAKGVTLFFLHGKDLADPHGLLIGSGKRVRSIRLKGPATLNRPQVRRLIGQACQKARVPLSEAIPRKLFIKSVSAKQRPRRALVAPKRPSRSR